MFVYIRKQNLLPELISEFNHPKIIYKRKNFTVLKLLHRMTLTTGEEKSSRKNPQIKSVIAHLISWSSKCSDNHRERGNVLERHHLSCGTPA